MKELERKLKALANKRRLEILQYLKREGEASVGDIALAIKLSFKSTSRHLSVLVGANLLDKEQKNLFVFYKIEKDLLPFIKAVLNSL